MATTGSCWCGALQYSFSDAPAMKALCHCQTCKKVSGSTYTANLVVPRTAFKLTSGTPKTFAKEHESGMTLTIHFCGTCGSTIYKEGTAEAFAGVVLIQAGTVHGGEIEGPGAELYVVERPDWLVAVKGTGQMLDFSRPVADVMS